MADVNETLAAAGAGDRQAAADLLLLIYDELRALAAAKLAAEKPGQTLQPTALVHEAYLRLVGGHADGWQGRAHFFAAAAEAMRRILIERARRKGRQKRGGELNRVDMATIEAATLERDDDLLALDEALDLFAQEDSEKAEMVKLRYFAGLSVEEAGNCLGVSRATADRYWAYARAWLYERLSR